MKKIKFLLLISVSLILSGSCAKDQSAANNKRPGPNLLSVQMTARNGIITQTLKNPEFVLYYFDYATKFDSIRAIIESEGFKMAVPSDLRKLYKNRQIIILLNELSKPMPILAFSFSVNRKIKINGPNQMTEHFNWKDYICSVLTFDSINRAIIQDLLLEECGEDMHDFWFLAVKK